MSILGSDKFVGLKVSYFEFAKSGICYSYVRTCTWFGFRNIGSFLLDHEDASRIFRTNYSAALYRQSSSIITMLNCYWIKHKINIFVRLFLHLYMLLWNHLVDILTSIWEAGHVIWALAQAPVLRFALLQFNNNSYRLKTNRRICATSLQDVSTISTKIARLFFSCSTSSTTSWLC